MTGIPRHWRHAGIVGQPPRSVIRQLNARAIRISDLDEPQGQTDLEATSALVPRVYCAVLRTVVANALNRTGLDGVIVDVGPGKCDGARSIAHILAGMGIPVLCVENRDHEGCGFPLSQSDLPLRQKMSGITTSVCLADPLPLPDGVLSPCRPVAAFWGVPPHDFSILDLFPAATHVFGWARCMENKTPAAFNLELHFDPAVPTVFFSQSFCAKSAVARNLAARHPRALALDCDTRPGSSVRAKIEAFLELSGAG